MTRNVGMVDKGTRILVALALIALGFFTLTDPVWKTVAFVVAGVMVVTALAGFCPLYGIVGIKTCRKT